MCQLCLLYRFIDNKQDCKDIINLRIYRCEHRLQAFMIPDKIITIDQHVIAEWLERSGDTNPIHTDSSYAIAHKLQDIVIPGNLITSVFIQMIDEWKNKDQMISEVRIAHKRIIYANATVSFRATIKQIDGKDVTIETAALCENQKVSFGNIKVTRAK